MNAAAMQKVFEKVNVKSVSLLSALVLICSGIFMCLKRIQEHGSIDLKSSLVSGQIQAGSLGLMVIFLGVFIVLAVVLRSGVAFSKRGERIEIEFEGKKVICENISFRKVQEIRSILESD
jgi:hypothetical protein